MTQWRITGREYIAPSNITRVTLTEDENWQRLVVNIAGNLNMETDEYVVERALEVFVSREVPQFAQEIIDQNLSVLKKELEETRQDIVKATDLLDDSRKEVASAQRDLGTVISDVGKVREEVSEVKEDLTDTKNDLLGTQGEVSETKVELLTTQGVLEDAKKSIDVIREDVDNLVVSIQDLTGEQKEALDGKYDEWETGVSYETGNKIHYKGMNYEVIQPHTSQEGWTPESTYSLYKEIKNDEVETDEGTIEVIDEFEESSTNPYQVGDKVSFEGKVYESTIDNNVWSPIDYPQGWKEIQ